MSAYVYAFGEGDRHMAELLGGKGANLAEMTRLGLPVPPGFTVTTGVCRHFLETGAEPPGLDEEIAAALSRLESATGHRLGQPDDPLLVSVRSGARNSMPGMLETVLDIGLTEESVPGLARLTGRPRFARDSYRRLLQMFGSTVMGLDPELFEQALERRKEERGAGRGADRGAAPDARLGADELAALAADFRRIIRSGTGEEFPQDPAEQLRRAIRAVFTSWNGERARVYRRYHHIPDDLGTAVNVQAMVFGNLGPDSGSGVAFTRDPVTGAPGLYGEYLPEAQGEDVVAGVRDALPLSELERLDPAAYARLTECAGLLECRYQDLCDLEFTVERGTLWMLQTRVGKRTAEAAFRIAYDMADEHRITPHDALRRVTGDELARLMFPRFAVEGTARPLARGIAASPGAAVGVAVFDSAEAVRRRAVGERTVLVRRETSAEDLPGLVAADAVVTSHGGKTSHAAVVARGMGKVCVCGADALAVDPVRRRFVLPDGSQVREGTPLSVDGTEGTVHLGTLPLTESPLIRHLESGGGPTGVAVPVGRALAHADRIRRLEVRANADTPEDAARARRFGAQGIGLCRTEHMFLGERRVLIENMVLARDEKERHRALAALLPLQRADFTGILRAMDGLPVTVRLLDPPLHEFLPGRTETAVRIAAAQAGGNAPDPRDLRLSEALDRLVEQNPMLGLRGVRLGLVVPGLFALQTRALAEAMARRLDEGGDPRPEIMVPLVAEAAELRVVREAVERVLAEVSEATGHRLHCPVGTMIELPRAALTADRIAAHADFFSLGTNDLTQTTWGLSRDDAETNVLPAYLDQGLLRASPFETIDPEGVGRLVRTALERGRAARPGLTVGVCGEHGGDPASVHFFHRAGLDYVSCSPFRVPVARLEAGRATILQEPRDTRGDTDGTDGRQEERGESA
ncbi:pyruvate, phosphate dikinase [Streptomyces sp. NPDC048172]|uniref:pyruvate, phosphate dikinase n=1 Tax=Streptomyces sp. NPDC048172 TaxID=3365505 RepID=UPI00370F9DA7